MLTNHTPYAGRAVGALCNFLKGYEFAVPPHLFFEATNDCIDAPDSLPHGGTLRLSDHSESSAMSNRDGWQR